MPIRVNLPNGGIANFPVGTPPQEIERALAEVQLTAPLPGKQTSFNTPIPSPTDPGLLSDIDAIEKGPGGVFFGGSSVMTNSPFLGDPVSAASKIPGVIGRTVSKVAAKYPSVVPAAVGAAPGLLEGDLKQAAKGGAMGYLTGRIGARTGATEAAPAARSTGSALLDNIHDPEAFQRAVQQMRDKGAFRSAPTPTAAAPTQSSFAMEMLKREPNWRITDAVPIDAIKRDVINGGTIIEAGESQLGLATRLADLLKKPTPSQLVEAERLAKALRQRGHIQGRQGQ